MPTSFRTSHQILIHFRLSSILVVVISLVNVAYLSSRNKIKKRPGERAKLLEKYVVANNKKQGKDEGKDDDGDDDGDDGDDDGKLRAWIELGDQHPDFVYTLWSWKPFSGRYYYYFYSSPFFLDLI